MIAYGERVGVGRQWTENIPVDFHSEGGALMTTVESVNKDTLLEVETYLTAHEETSQFLMNNLTEHGPSLTDHSNSGNFKLIRDNGKIVAVFCLTRRGNVIIQSDRDRNRPFS